MLQAGKDKGQTSTTETVSRFVTSWAQRARRKEASKGPFTLDGAVVSDAELGNPSVLLPLFAWHAEGIYRYSMRQRGLGLHFINDAEALLQRSVNLNKTDRSVSELLAFMLEAAEDARQHLPNSATVPGAVELRGLVNQFAAEMGVTATPGPEVPVAGAKLQA